MMTTMVTQRGHTWQSVHLESWHVFSQKCSVILVAQMSGTRVGHDVTGERSERWLCTLMIVTAFGLVIVRIYLSGKRRDQTSHSSIT